MNVPPNGKSTASFSVPYNHSGKFAGVPMESVEESNRKIKGADTELRSDVNQVFANVDQAVTSVRQDVTSLQSRMDDKLNQLSQQGAQSSIAFTQLSETVGSNYTELKGNIHALIVPRLDEQASMLRGQGAALEERVVKVNTDLSTISTNLTVFFSEMREGTARIGERLDHIDRRLETLERSVFAINERLDVNGGVNG